MNFEDILLNRVSQFHLSEMILLQNPYFKYDEIFLKKRRFFGHYHIIQCSVHCLKSSHLVFQ